MNDPKPKLETHGRSYQVLVHPTRDMGDGTTALSLWGYTVDNGRAQPRRMWVQWRADNPVESWPCYTTLRQDQVQPLLQEKLGRGYKSITAHVFHDADIIQAWHYIKGNAVERLAPGSDALLLVDAIDEICRNQGHPLPYVDRALEFMRGIAPSQVKVPRKRGSLCPGILAW